MSTADRAAVAARLGDPDWWTADGKGIIVPADPLSRLLAEPIDVERLARAIHESRSSESWVGCGWEFGSEVDGRPLCPCPSDAAKIVAEYSRLAEPG